MSCLEGEVRIDPAFDAEEEGDFMMEDDEEEATAEEVKDASKGFCGF